MKREYGFEVDYGLRLSNGAVVLDYVVELPHSCDEWVITISENKQTAITDLEQFIDEAQSALKKLRELP